MLGNALCDTLNGIRQNNNTVRVEKDNLFWLTQSNCVWADIVGDNKAMEYLFEKVGDTSNTPNMYNQNKDLIHSQFHQNTLPSELNQILRMPMEASDTIHFTQQLSNTRQMANNTSTKVLSRLSSSNKAQNLQPVTILTIPETSVRLTHCESSVSSPSIHPHHYTSKFCKTYSF